MTLLGGNFPFFLNGFPRHQTELLADSVSGIQVEWSGGRLSASKKMALEALPTLSKADNFRRFDYTTRHVQPRRVIHRVSVSSIRGGIRILLERFLVTGIETGKDWTAAVATCSTGWTIVPAWCFDNWICGTDGNIVPFTTPVSSRHLYNGCGDSS